MLLNLYVFGVSCCNVFFSQFLKLILNPFVMQICTFCLGLSKGFRNTKDEILIPVSAWRSSLCCEECCRFKACKNSVQYG